MRIHKLPIIMLAIACAAVACTKDEDTANQFPSLDTDSFKPRDVSDLRTFVLSNGASVYLQEEHTKEEVAIEVFYRAGYMQEPSGKTQIAHLAEHAIIFSQTQSHQADASVEILRANGKVNAEAVGDFVHYDYIIARQMLEEALAIEAEHLTSVKFSQDILAREAEGATREIVSGSTNGRSMAKFALSALNQVVHHGQKHVELSASMAKLTVNDMQLFHDTYYRVDDMVIVLIGDFQMDEAETLVRKHFESIPSKPTPTRPRASIRTDVKATWDINLTAGFLVFDGEYGSYRERLILMIYGAYLGREMMTATDVGTYAVSTSVTNLIYRLDWVPFYAYLQPKSPEVYHILRDAFVTEAAAARERLTGKAVELLKTNTIGYLTSTFLKKDAPPPTNVPHYREIGQEAVNVGIKHYFREGRSTEEVIEMINSITPEEMTTVVDKFITPSQMKELLFTPR